MHKSFKTFTVFFIMFISTCYSEKISLETGWKLQDGNIIQIQGRDGNEISLRTYNTKDWLTVSYMPSTVMSVLVENEIYKDIFYGENLKQIKWMTDRSWWFRKTFNIDSSGKNKYWLYLKGIGTCATIWINGKVVATKDEIRGVHNAFVLDVTQFISHGLNTIALEIADDKSNFGAFHWVDWNPTPPDNNMGIWKDIYLKCSGIVEIRNPYVTTKLPLPSLEYADLTVSIDLANTSNEEVYGTIKGEIAGIPFSQKVILNALTQKTVLLNPIRLKNPKLWWPNGVGEANLYHLDIHFEINNEITDKETIRFGIKQVEHYLSDPVNGIRWTRFKVNGKDILVRGGAYRPDLLLRQDKEKDEAEVRYWKDMGWNMVRFEGSMGNEYIFDLCDSLGIMIEAGWVCCSPMWEDTGVWSNDKLAEAKQMMLATGLSLRHHASAATFFLGSDLQIHKEALDNYHKTLDEIRWSEDKFYLDQTAFWVNENNEFKEKDFSSGIHMRGPYDISTPMVWWSDPYQGAIGSCAEHSTGGCIPHLESVKKFISPDSLWPIHGNNREVDFHTGYRNLNLTIDYINERYGESTTAEHFFDIKAQLNNYEQVRAQFEAFGTHKHKKAFHSIYWMGNNAWPGLKWQLYDYYLKPTAGYFGYKKATRPVAIVFELNTENILVLNSTYKVLKKLKATASLFTIEKNGTVIKHGNSIYLDNISIQEDSVVNVMNLSSALNGISRTYFLKLELHDKNGVLLADNVYWYSTQKDINDTAITDYGQRFWKQMADLKGLNNLLLNRNIEFKVIQMNEENDQKINLQIKNSSVNNLAFFIKVEITDKENGNEILPVIYSDNYITLWPGESKIISAIYDKSLNVKNNAWIRIKGFNVPELNKRMNDVPN